MIKEVRASLYLLKLKYQEVSEEKLDQLNFFESFFSSSQQDSA
jgi:hypothetical protein